MTLPVSFFADIYDGTDDPWGFRDRWYEERKRSLTLAALPRRRFARGFEPGCSNGELTAGLAARCDELIACDISPEAAAAARRRTARLPGVTVEEGAVPSYWPAESFDLIVLSEMAYYLSDADLAALTRTAHGALRPGGVLLGCHWRHPVADYPQTGDHVHEVLGAGLARIGGWLDEDLRLDVWSEDPTSVATRDGLT